MNYGFAEIVAFRQRAVYMPVRDGARERVKGVHSYRRFRRTNSRRHRPPPALCSVLVETADEPRIPKIEDE